MLDALVPAADALIEEKGLTGRIVRILANLLSLCPETI